MEGREEERKEKEKKEGRRKGSSTQGQQLATNIGVKEILKERQAMKKLDQVPCVLISKKLTEP